jgi:hypothetical protein
MVGPIEMVLGPWRAVRLLARAAEDLNAVAERARRDPDPVEQARERLQLKQRRWGGLYGRPPASVLTARAQ